MKTNVSIIVGVFLLGGAVIYSCKKHNITELSNNEVELTQKNSANSDSQKKDAELIRLIKSDISDVELGNQLLEEVPLSEQVTRALINRPNMNEGVLEVCLVSNEETSNQLIVEMINTDVSEHIIERVLMISGIDKNMEQVLKKRMPNLNIENIKQIGKDKIPVITLCCEGGIMFADEVYIDEFTDEVVLDGVVQVPFSINVTNDNIEELRTGGCGRKWKCGDRKSTHTDTNPENGNTILRFKCLVSPERCYKLGKRIGG